MVKECVGCGTSKDEDDFYTTAGRNGIVYRRKICKACVNERARTKTKCSRPTASTAAARKQWIQDNPIRSMLHQARGRAKQRSRECTVTVEYLVRLWTEQDGRCAVTGLPFEAAKHDQFRARPYCPSLDRIDSQGGYTPGNVRYVLWAVNQALGNFGESVFNKIAEAATARNWLHIKDDDNSVTA